ncbi:hypothetical protein DL93DRAFT_2171018 [Clavulina sp. PMI_390]|nr:hypothetical protein DL93DRAFT_2171018 [Clavulina sp. PMI_390]
MPMPEKDGKRLHNQLMRAADSSRAFLPSSGQLQGMPSSSQAGTSFIPDFSSRPRKLSKLTKRRPSTKNGSTPPSAFRGTPVPNDDAFIDAVISNVESLVPKPRTAPKNLARRPSDEAERSFIAPDARDSWDTNAPTRSQPKDIGSSARSTPPPLRRSTSSIELGLAERSGSSASQNDPFGRNAPSSLPRPAPAPASVPRPALASIPRPPPAVIPRPIPGPPPPSAAVQPKVVPSTTSGGNNPPMKQWTTKDYRDTIIALYRPPPGTTEAERLRALEEKDDTIIALYRPPPAAAKPPNPSSSSSPTPAVRATRRRSNSIAIVPSAQGRSTPPFSQPSLGQRPVQPPAGQLVVMKPLDSSTSRAASPPTAPPATRGRSATVGSRPDAVTNNSGRELTETNLRPRLQPTKSSTNLNASYVGNPVADPAPVTFPAISGNQPIPTPSRPLRSAMKRPLAPPPLSTIISNPPSPSSTPLSTANSSTSSSSPSSSTSIGTSTATPNVAPNAAVNLIRPARSARRPSTAPQERSQPQLLVAASRSQLPHQVSGPQDASAPSFGSGKPARIVLPRRAQTSDGRPSVVQTHQPSLSAGSSTESDAYPQTPASSNWETPLYEVKIMETEPLRLKPSSRAKKQLEPIAAPVPSITTSIVETAPPSEAPDLSLLQAPVSSRLTTASFTSTATASSAFAKIPPPSTPASTSNFLNVPTTPLTPLTPPSRAESSSVPLNDIGRSFLMPISEASSPVTPSFGGKASDIRNRILNERGGRV